VLASAFLSGALSAIDTPPNFRAELPRPTRLLRVFLVEDLPAVRELIIESLAEIPGLELAGCADTEDSALAWLRAHECDIVILDLELKQGNGIGVLRALSRTGRRPGPVKIVYSNHVSANIRGLAEKFGAAYFFDKTLDTAGLWRLLEGFAAARN
jgi:DNA-binding NarL/FixJ family response regulator